MRARWRGMNFPLCVKTNAPLEALGRCFCLLRNLPLQRKQHELPRGQAQLGCPSEPGFLLLASIGQSPVIARLKCSLQL